MEKITIQYFLNKDLNPQISGRIKKYPVYIQVITLRKHLRFKSNNILFEYLSDEELNNPLMQSLFAKEKEAIYNITRDLIVNEKKDLITSKNLSLYSKRVFDVIEYNFCKLLLRETKGNKKFAPDLFLSATYSEINEVIYFYNDDSPISSISEKVALCIDAFQVLYKQDFDFMDKYYVYDLFGGAKNKDILDDLNCFNSSNEKHINEIILAMQDLASL